MSEAITFEESQRLVVLEKTIASGMQTFIEVGEALAEIRDSKLYKIEHDTFEDYCQKKWQMTARRAQQLVSAAEVVADCSKIGTIVPKTESQARPLTSIPREQRAEVFAEASATSATGKPTAREVQVVVEKRKRKREVRAMVKASNAKGNIDPKKTTPLNYAPANGVQYAMMAILNLEKIQPNDTERAAALHEMRAWLDERVNKVRAMAHTWRRMTESEQADFIEWTYAIDPAINQLA